MRGLRSGEGPEDSGKTYAHSDPAAHRLIVARPGENLTADRRPRLAFLRPRRRLSGRPVPTAKGGCDPHRGNPRPARTGQDGVEQTNRTIELRCTADPGIHEGFASVVGFVLGNGFVNGDSTGVTRKRDIGGVMTARPSLRLFRRAGAALGALALAIQCLLFAFHQPAQATTFSPFQDPAAFCGTTDHGGAGLPDQGNPKAPLHGGLVCPICQSLHAAGTGLVPPIPVLVPPAAVQVSPWPAADISGAAPFGQFAASPRAPPSIL